MDLTDLSHRSRSPELVRVRHFVHVRLRLMRGLLVQRSLQHLHIVVPAATPSTLQFGTCLARILAIPFAFRHGRIGALPNETTPGTFVDLQVQFRDRVLLLALRYNYEALVGLPAFLLVLERIGADVDVYWLFVYELVCF